MGAINITTRSVRKKGERGRRLSEALWIWGGGGKREQNGESERLSANMFPNNILLIQ